MLLKKLFRTAWKYKAQFISMIIMVAIGIGVFVGFHMEWYSIKKNTDNFFTKTEYFQWRLVSENGFSAEDVQNIHDMESYGVFAHRVLKVNVGVKDSKNSLSLWCEEGGFVKGFYLTSGQEYSENFPGFWLWDKYAEKNDIKVGDTLAVVYNGLTVEAPVMGLGKSGEYLVCTSGETQLMPDASTFGFAFVSPVTIENALSAFNEAHGANLTVPYPYICFQSERSKEELEEMTERALGFNALLLGKEETASYSAAQGEIEEGKSMGAILPVMFLLIAVLTMVTTMHRIAASEKTQIGTLKALGFQNSKILAHYSSYGLFIGIVGLMLGTGIGYLIAYVVMNPHGTMGTYFDMPEWKLYMPGFCIPVGILTVLFMTGISFLSVKKMMKGSAADALRPYSPKKMRPMLIEKTRAFNKMSFGTRWNLRDCMRHKARSFMTLFGVIGCMILIVGGLGMKDTMGGFMDIIGDEVNHYETKIVLSEKAQNAQAASMAAAVGGDWNASVSGKADGKTVALEVWHVENDMVRFLNKKNDRVTLSDEGAYICLRLADRYKVGDVIEFSPYGSDRTYRLPVIGILRSTMVENIVVTDKYAESYGDAGIPYQIGAVYSPKNAEETSALLPEGSAGMVSAMQEKQQILDTYDSFMEIMDLMVLLLIVAALVLGVVVLYNLGVMSYIERSREMATLKVVGFDNRKIAGLLIGQNLWLSILGVLLGLPCGVGVLQVLIVTLASEYELKLVLGPLTYSVSILLTLGVSLIVSFFVARKNRKINMVEALKFAE